MRKRFRILVVILTVSLLGGFAYEVLRPHEPIYQEQALTFWLKQYSYTNHSWVDFHMQPKGELGRQAETAIRQIGTNAIPTLLEMLRAEDSPAKLRLLEFLHRQSFVKIKRYPAFDKNSFAACGFSALDSDARDAVPALTKIYEQNISPSSAAWTAYALASIGPAAKSAIPALILGMTNSDARVRHYTIHALSRIHAEPELTVPALARSLTNTAVGVEIIAVDALGTFGADARPAIPILLKMLETPDADLRDRITNALKRIDPETAVKAGVK